MKGKKFVAVLCAFITACSAAAFSGCNFLFGDEDNSTDNAPAGEIVVPGDIQKPEEPEEPQTPEEPEQPEQPEQPEEPQTPEEPEQPEEPQTPEEPEQPEEPQTPEVVVDDEYIMRHAYSTYGYDWLGTQPNGEALQSFYRQLDDLAQSVFYGDAYIEPTSYYDSNTGTTRYFYTAGKAETNVLNGSEVNNVYRLYCYDHPYNFWQNQACLSEYSTSVLGRVYYAHMLVEEDYNTYEKLSAAKKEINKNIKNALQQADGLDNGYEITLALQNAIVRRGDYTYGEDDMPSTEYWAHGIVSVFDDDVATGPICEGYARSFQLLLNLKGLENVYCVGIAEALGAGGGGGHAWNLVKLDDGKWYYYDITWDDGNDADGGEGGTVTYEYFAVSRADTPSGVPFETSHTVGNSNSLNGYYLYDMPSDIAQTPYAGGALPVRQIKTVDGIEYVRNGLNSVGVHLITKLDAEVFIPQNVTIDGREYTVTEIGPYVNSEGKYAPVLVKGTLRTIHLPQTITAIGIAAFNCSWKITVYFGGTRQQWDNIIFGTSSFKIQPDIYCEQD